MPIWKDKKNIAIWGFGKEAQSALTFLKEKNPNANYQIYSDQSDLFEDILPEEALEKTLRNSSIDLIIKSPGISLYHPLCNLARQNNIQISSATNLWFDTYGNQDKTVVITGTKGKSTTASLMHHLLTKLGYDVTLAGNIGTNLLDQPPAKDFTIIELSSYQLADLHYAPDLFMVTNLFKEHTPWHGSEDKYYQDKLSPKSRHRELQCITNNHSKMLKTLWSKKENIIWSSTENLNIEQPKTLAGDHNLENISLVLNAIDHLTQQAEKAKKHLSSYTGLEHRLNEIGQRDGVTYVDDSISTIPEATLAALNVYKDKKIVLVMGGSDRGQDYSDLAEKLGSYDIAHLFLLPENGSHIAHHLADVFPYSMEETLQDIARKSDDIEKDIVLLSPGAPSYSQFKNFEERGDTFAKVFGF